MNCGYCFGCMEEIDHYPCPRCGYEPGVESLSYTLQPGMILKGRYLIGKVLGQGGFGITYIGMDLSLQRKVAIKEFFPPNYASRKYQKGTVEWYTNDAARDMKQSGQEMFLKEARKMGRVSNIPEVVHVYDIFQENDTAYICMGFIEGITLMQHLKAKGPLTWTEAQKIFLPVMTAMERVHQAGLVHRDISPDNIMIESDGSIRILDLGAAKDLNVNSGKSSMQVAKNGFSPPEQYMPSGQSGSWTDVYAMAATLYFSLTGKVPMPAIDRMALVAEDPAWSHPKLLALPQTVQKALKRAMAMDIAHRTQTMAEFARQLQAEPVPIPVPKPKAEPRPEPKIESWPEPKPTEERKPVQKAAVKAGPKPVDQKPTKKQIGVLAAVAAVVLLLGFCIGFLRSCASDEIPCKSLTVTSETEVELTVGESHQIDAVPAPENTTDTVTYESSDPDVASVTSSGKIVAVGEGKATIVISCGTLQKTVDVVCYLPDVTEETTAETTAAFETEPEETEIENDLQEVGIDQGSGETDTPTGIIPDTGADEYLPSPIKPTKPTNPKPTEPKATEPEAPGPEPETETPKPEPEAPEPKHTEPEAPGPEHIEPEAPEPLTGSM